MKQLKQRGYVTPADCGGSIQNALELAHKLDINKVVLTGELTAAEPLVLRSGMYLVLENCTLQADLVTEQQENYSFRQQFIPLRAAMPGFWAISIFSTPITLPSPAWTSRVS